MDTLQEQEAVRRPKSVAAVLAAFILIVFILYAGRLFFITLVTAVLLAFILEPLVGFFMRMKVPRGGASFLACTVMLISLYLAGLGAWTQAVGFFEALPLYTQRITDLVDSATVRLEEVERAARDLLVPQRVRDAELAAAKAKAEAEAARKAAAKRRRPVVDAPLPLPEEPVGKQGWYWWFDHALWWKLSMPARADYQKHETPLYIDYLQVFDEAAYDRESQQIAFMRYKARMASVLAELMAGLYVPAVEVQA